MKRVIAFGNPLLDTIVLLQDKSLLEKYNLDVDGQKEISLSEMEALKEDIKDYDKTVTAGGCAQNTLKILQWLLKKEYSVTMCGAIGGDSEGKLLEEILKQHGIEPHYIVHKAYPTGTTVSLVTNDNRSLVAHLGAAEIVPLQYIHGTDIITQIEQSDLVYMEGFFLTKRTKTATFILNHCTSHNKMFAFNLCGEYLVDSLPELVDEFLSQADIIFGNRKEFDKICSLKGVSVENFLTALSEHGRGKIIAVTNGPSAVMCFGHGESCVAQAPTLSTEEIVDTTGAGDSFAGGFLAGYLQEKSLKECLQLGCHAAYTIIKRRGCTVPEFSAS
ncbi:hypothetical protein Zmor_020471 [Zophobas morio]|uniref:Adenosine kinase n=1 Tax=Zophobas morio TaxID=2755281 RepID=A0AA38I1C3_9CUCU|nr:hypothetical protein Zmor_020471 [Zophobas morio]